MESMMYGARRDTGELVRADETHESLEFPQTDSFYEMMHFNFGSMGVRELRKLAAEGIEQPAAFTTSASRALLKHGRPRVQ